MDIHEYARSRGVTQEMLDEAHERTMARIEAYNLAQARRSRHMTQRQIAKAMGVAQPRVSAIENGEIDSVELRTIRKYVKSLGANLVLSVEWPDKTIRLA